MMAAVICREFGWTWDEYENQPAEFIDCIVAMLQAEGAQQSKKPVTSNLNG